jgi:hypothetical protein
MGILHRLGSLFRRHSGDSIPDLKLIDYSHAVSLAFRPDIPSPLRALAVGWLGSAVPSNGDVDASSMLALRNANANQRTDSGELGYHTCSICGRFQDRGEFIVQANSRTYVLPRMVLHYIEVHGYRPPEAFLSDLLAWWCIERRTQQNKALQATATAPPVL